MGIGNHPKFPDEQGDDLPRGQHGVDYGNCPFGVGSREVIVA